MGQRGANTGYQVVNQKSLGPPHVFKHIAKHPQRKHIENNVRQVFMHKHIGNKLKRTEFLCAKIVET